MRSVTAHFRSFSAFRGGFRLHQRRESPRLFRHATSSGKFEAETSAEIARHGRQRKIHRVARQPAITRPAVVQPALDPTERVFDKRPDRRDQAVEPLLLGRQILLPAHPSVAQARDHAAIAEFFS